MKNRGDEGGKKRKKQQHILTFLCWRSSEIWRLRQTKVFPRDLRPSTVLSESRCLDARLQTLAGEVEVGRTERECPWFSPRSLHRSVKKASTEKSKTLSRRHCRTGKPATLCELRHWHCSTLQKNPFLCKQEARLSLTHRATVAQALCSFSNRKL